MFAPRTDPDVLARGFKQTIIDYLLGRPARFQKASIAAVGLEENCAHCRRLVRFMRYGWIDMKTGKFYCTKGCGWTAAKVGGKR